MKWVFRIFNFSEHILWCDYHITSVRRQDSSNCALLYYQSSLISIRCHEITFPSHDNRNQVVYHSIKLRHVTTWSSSIFRSKRNQASLYARRTKCSRTKDSIKDIIAASTVTHVLSFSFCHYVTAEALPSTSV